MLFLGSTPTFELAQRLETCGAEGALSGARESLVNIRYANDASVCHFETRAGGGIPPGRTTGINPDARLTFRSPSNEHKLKSRFSSISGSFNMPIRL